jgi:hypothetical protein
MLRAERTKLSIVGKKAMHDEHINATFEKASGERSGPFKTKFGANQLTIFNDKLIVNEGNR